MRTAAWGPVVALICLLAACGEVPPVSIDAAGTTACVPACDTNATCTGTTCACNAGYTGDGVTCTDTNECTTNNGGCDINATCTNVPGSRSCACLPGFIGDGVTCRQSWARVGTLAGINLNPENFGAIATGLGARIFFGPRANTAGNRFMRSFDTSTMTFAGAHALPPGTQTGFCACGLESIFVSDGTQLFLFGSEAYRYAPGNNTWTQITTYTAALARGRSAGAYEGNNNVVYQVSGRDNSGANFNNTQRYSVAAGTFTIETGTMPFTVTEARAWAPAGNNVTYVAGGFASDGNRRHLFSHATGSGAYQVLADAPADLGQIDGMGDYMGKIWVASRTHLFFYDPTTSAWRTTGVPVPMGFVLAVNAASGTYAFAQNAGSIEVYKLVNID